MMPTFAFTPTKTAVIRHPRVHSFSLGGLPPNRFICLGIDKDQFLDKNLFLVDIDKMNCWRVPDIILCRICRRIINRQRESRKLVLLYSLSTAIDTWSMRLWFFYLIVLIQESQLAKISLWGRKRAAVLLYYTSFSFVSSFCISFHSPSTAYSITLFQYTGRACCYKQSEERSH